MEISNLNKELKAIDEEIEGYRRDIERGKALAELKQDSRFIDVILDGYFEVEAQKLFQILIDPTNASPYSNEEIQLKLEAISHFKGYVGTSSFAGSIQNSAENAPGLITSAELYREEITAGNADNGEV